MVNYVTSVFVGTGKTYTASKAVISDSSVNDDLVNDIDIEEGQFVVIDAESGKVLAADTEDLDKVQAIKIGQATEKTFEDKEGNTRRQIHWSNKIDKKYIKSVATDTYAANTEEAVYLNFTSVTPADGERFVIRITYKDMPTRYRKWTDSVEYVASAGDTAAKVVAGLTKALRNAYKRLRVKVALGTIDTTSTNGESIDGTNYFHAVTKANEASKVIMQLKAIPFADNEDMNTISPAAFVRFNVNAYKTNTKADGFETNNKYAIAGLDIEKVPAKIYKADSALVRDREIWAMGYDGILNRGEGTWPIIKPKMFTDKDGHYDSLVIEFENMYRAADDIQRHTKQCVEVYEINSKGVVAPIISEWLNPTPAEPVEEGIGD